MELLLSSSMVKDKTSIYDNKDKNIMERAIQYINKG